jgi:GNAT superfamily N-acetyltransferase
MGRSSEPQRAAGAVVIRPLTPARWPELVRLFGKHGGCAGCWCMYPRIRHKDYVAGKGAVNRRRLRALVARREVHGLLASVGGEPAAWCSLGPRETFPSLAKSRVLAPLDDRPVWSIVCFYIDRRHRRRCLSPHLLEAAAAYAARHGATLLEGYPHDRARAPLPDAFAWHGLLTSFQRAGFEEVARRSAGRPIVRRALTKPRPSKARRTGKPQPTPRQRSTISS